MGLGNKGESVLYEVTGSETTKYILAGGREIAKVMGTGNLLTENQASVEKDTSGFSPCFGGTISRTTERSSGPRPESTAGVQSRNPKGPRKTAPAVPGAVSFSEISRRILSSLAKTFHSVLQDH